eukprot:169640_1
MSEDNALVGVTGHYYSYYNEIVQNSSTNRLKKFIDALNNDCLKDMVSIYIKSMIEQPNYDKMKETMFNKKLAQKNQNKINKNKTDANKNVLLLLKKYCMKKKKK